MFASPNPFALLANDNVYAVHIESPRKDGDHLHNTVGVQQHCGKAPLRRGRERKCAPRFSNNSDTLQFHNPNIPTVCLESALSFLALCDLLSAKRASTRFRRAADAALRRSTVIVLPRKFTAAQKQRSVQQFPCVSAFRHPTTGLDTAKSLSGISHTLPHRCVFDARYLRPEDLPSDLQLEELRLRTHVPTASGIRRTLSSFDHLRELRIRLRVVGQGQPNDMMMLTSYIVATCPSRTTLEILHISTDASAYDPDVLSEDELENVPKLESLTELNLGHSAWDFDDFANVLELFCTPKLRRVGELPPGNDVEDVVEVLSKFPNLEYVLHRKPNLNSDSAVPSTFRDLIYRGTICEHFPGLTEVDDILAHTALEFVESNSHEHATHFHNLKRIEVSFLKAMPNLCKLVSHLSNIESLSVTSCSVMPDAFTQFESFAQALEGCVRLRTLKLDMLQLDNDDFECFLRLKSLQTLCLKNYCRPLSAMRDISYWTSFGKGLAKTKLQHLRFEVDKSQLITRGRLPTAWQLTAVLKGFARRTQPLSLLSLSNFDNASSLQAERGFRSVRVAPYLELAKSYPYVKAGMHVREIYVSLLEDTKESEYNDIGSPVVLGKLLRGRVHRYDVGTRLIGEKTIPDFSDVEAAENEEHEHFMTADHGETLTTSSFF